MSNSSTEPSATTGGMGEENRALIERELNPINLRIFDALYSESMVDHLLNAARAQGYEKALSDVRASWRGEENCRRLDDVRASIGGLRPGWVETLAMFQERFALMALEAARVQGPSHEQVAFDVERVKEVLAEGDGLWRSCSGCYETEDGQNVHGYPRSRTLGCTLGGGCSECGGLGAVWDTTDYEEMGRELSQPPPAPVSAPDLGAVERVEKFAGWCETARSDDDEAFNDYMDGELVADLRALLALATASPGLKGEGS